MLRTLVRSRQFLFGVIFTLFFVRSFTLLDPDFGWHLKAGEYFIAHGIPATDIFTYTAPNFPWIDHEWLADIFVAGLFHAGGYTLVAVVFAVLWTAAFWLISRRVNALLIVLAVLAVLPFAGIRTVTWSFLLLGICSIILHGPRWRGYLLPVLFLIWTNVHGSFIVGLALVMYEAIRQRSRRLLVIEATSLLATLINPYGWHLYQEVLRTVTDGSLHGQIREWATAAFPLSSLPYVLLWVGLFAVQDGKKIRSYLKPDVAMLLAALSSVRNMPLFVVLSLESLQRRIESVRRQLPAQLDPKRRRFVRNTGIALGVLVVLVTIVSFRTFTFDREASYPKQAVTDLAAKPCSGRLFNSYDYGGYLIWRLPGKPVYIDGRMPSWQSGTTKYLDDYTKILKDPSFQKAQFTKYGITCALVKQSENALVASLIKQGWNYRSYPDGSLLLRRR